MLEEICMTKGTLNPRSKLAAAGVGRMNPSECLPVVERPDEVAVGFNLMPFGNSTVKPQVTVPEGQSRIAQRFSVGNAIPQESSPVGTAELSWFRAQFGRPSGTWSSSDTQPNAKALGYSRDVPPGQGPMELPKGIRHQPTVFARLALRRGATLAGCITSWRSFIGRPALL